ncbi:MAG: hypothetical protein IKI06_07915 [Prevotella sp.]|nr:hypothetical protein [Prevotella sp.]
MKIVFSFFLLLFFQSCDVWPCLNEISNESIHCNTSFNVNDSIWIKVGCRSKGNKLNKISIFQTMISKGQISQGDFKISQSGKDLPFIIDYAQNRRWIKMTEYDNLNGKQFIRLSFRPLTNCSDVIEIQEMNIYDNIDTLKLYISPNNVIINGIFLDSFD